MSWLKRKDKNKYVGFGMSHIEIMIIDFMVNVVPLVRKFNM